MMMCCNRFVDRSELAIEAQTGSFANLRSGTMNREHVLKVAILLAFVALPGAAHAGQGITDYWRNEARPSSRPAITQTEPDQYRAHAMHGRARPAQVTPEVN